MPFDFQPTLKGALVELRHLSTDADELFAIASDPLIWEQHPVKDHYKPEVFSAFFREALASQGALAAIDCKDGRIIGSSRFHGYNAQAGEVPQLCKSLIIPSVRVVILSAAKNLCSCFCGSKLHRPLRLRSGQALNGAPGEYDRNFRFIIVASIVFA